jgi:hypothetical protein
MISLNCFFYWHPINASCLRAFCKKIYDYPQFGFIKIKLLFDPNRGRMFIETKLKYSSTTPKGSNVRNMGCYYKHLTLNGSQIAESVR